MIAISTAEIAISSCHLRDAWRSATDAAHTLPALTLYFLHIAGARPMVIVDRAPLRPHRRRCGNRCTLTHYPVCTAAYRFTVTAGHEDHARRDCTVGVSVIAVTRRRVAPFVSSSYRTAQSPTHAEIRPQSRLRGRHCRGPELNTRITVLIDDYDQPASYGIAMG